MTEKKQLRAKVALINSNNNYSNKDLHGPENTQLHNYVYNSLMHDVKLRSDVTIFQQLLGRGKLTVPYDDYNMCNDGPLLKFCVKKKEWFHYKMYDLLNIHKAIFFETNCTWLDHRLSLYGFLKDLTRLCFSEGQLMLHDAFIHVCVGLMTFYHTQSVFVVRLLRIDAVNLLLLIKSPVLEELIKPLPDGFSKLLLKFIRKPEIILNSKKFDIPDLSEQIIVNYFSLPPRYFSLREKTRHRPVVTYFNVLIPNKDKYQYQLQNSAFEKRLIGLERKFMCKFIIHQRFYRASPNNIQGVFEKLEDSKNANDHNEVTIKMDPNKQGDQESGSNIIFDRDELILDYITIEVIIDHRCIHWRLIIKELMDLLTGFSIVNCNSTNFDQRTQLPCYVEQIGVSQLRPLFFCCDEVQNLLKRQYIMSHTNPYFTELIHWVNKMQLDMHRI